MALKLLTPVMTSNTTPSGVVSADTFNINSFPDLSYAYYLFTQQSDATQPAPGLSLGVWFAPYNPPHWAEYDFGAPTVVTDFQTLHGARYLIDFELQGWDGSAWITLHAVTGSAVEYAWTPIQTVASPAAYTKCRIYVTEFYSPSFEGPPDDRCDLEGILLYGTAADIDAPAAPLAFVANAPTLAEGELVNAPPADFGFAPNAPSHTVGPVSLTMPVADFPFTPQAPGLTLVPDSLLPSSIVYRCTLTGPTDLVLPISSIHARYRNGRPSYLSVVVPDGVSYADDIADRGDGEIVLERGVKFFDGATQLVEIMRVALEDIRDDWGGSKRSVTLTGHKALTNTSPKPIEVQNVTYLFSGIGSRRVRADMDLNLRPGDTAAYPGGSIVVGTLSYTIGEAGEIMEITEAEGV